MKISKLIGAEKESLFDKEKFKKALKTLKEKKLKDLRILIEMELMRRDRWN